MWNGFGPHVTDFTEDHTLPFSSPQFHSLLPHLNQKQKWVPSSTWANLVQGQGLQIQMPASVFTTKLQFRTNVLFYCYPYTGSEVSLEQVVPHGPVPLTYYGCRPLLGPLHHWSFSLPLIHTSSHPPKQISPFLPLYSNTILKAQLSLSVHGNIFFF